MTKEAPSTIRVRKKTVERLRKIGKFGESYNDIITRVLNSYQEIIEEPPKKRRIMKMKTIKTTVK
ncbi:hypothetical protein ES703_56032 [subsurface metagenome]